MLEILTKYRHCTFYFCKGSGPGLVGWEREKTPLFSRNIVLILWLQREFQIHDSKANALKVMVFYKRVAKMFGWASFANSHGDRRTRESTTPQRSKGSFSQSPFAYLNVNSPPLQLGCCSLSMAPWHYHVFSLKFIFMLNEYHIWPWHL